MPPLGVAILHRRGVCPLPTVFVSTYTSPMAGASRGQARKSLFHVEDSAELRSRIEGEISRLAGIEVVGFSGRADDAIRQIRRLEPDIVVLDLQLEEGSGIDVLRSLGSATGPPTFIVLTNHSDSRFRKLSLRAGAPHFFDKSTQLAEFIEFLGWVVGPPI
jgi:DNA-binding NarL/FixJ family response regulator